MMIWVKQQAYQHNLQCYKIKIKNQKRRLKHLFLKVSDVKDHFSCLVMIIVLESYVLQYVHNMNIRLNKLL